MKTLMIRKSSLKNQRCGFDRKIGFFLVDRSSVLTDYELYDATKVREIIDKQGKKVPVLRLTPHRHAFQNMGDYHECISCGTKEPHQVLCPNTKCICGAEIEPQHLYTKVIAVKIQQTDKYYQRVEVYECERCQDIKEIITCKIWGSPEEIELIRRVLSLFDPFDKTAPEFGLWVDFTQSYVPINSIEDLIAHVGNEVLEDCKEGKWIKAYYYQVPWKKVAPVMFLGNVEGDMSYVYIKSLVKIPQFNQYEKETETFLPRRNWWKYYPPLKSCEKCVAPLAISKEAAEALANFFKKFDPQEVIEHFDQYAHAIAVVCKLTKT